jgi:hypothetical protein
VAPHSPDDISKNKDGEHIGSLYPTFSAIFLSCFFLASVAQVGEHVFNAFFGIAVAGESACEGGGGKFFEFLEQFLGGEVLLGEEGEGVFHGFFGCSPRSEFLGDTCGSPEFRFRPYFREVLGESGIIEDFFLSEERECVVNGVRGALFEEGVMAEFFFKGIAVAKTMEKDFQGVLLRVFSSGGRFFIPLRPREPLRVHFGRLPPV